MKKFWLGLLITIILTTNAVFAYDGYDNTTLRDFGAVEVPTGTFISVLSCQEISTLYNDVGTKVEFISTTDLYMRETNIVPKDTKFYGYVEKINEPIIGTNASMVIKITKMKMPDGFEIPLRGYIHTGNGNLIGGEMTEPATYTQKLSLRQGFYRHVVYVPGDQRKMGEQTTIASGADLIIVLISPMYVTHTLTNWQKIYFYHNNINWVYRQRF